jgi:hypothetical protein
VGGAPDPEWYFEHVLADALPFGERPRPAGAAETWRRWWDAQARDDDPATALARSQGFVVTIDQRRALGWQRHDDRRELRRGTWSAVARGIRTPVAVDRDNPSKYVLRRRSHALLATATSLTRADHVISGRSAAILSGLPTLWIPTRPELTAGDVALGRRDLSHVFGATLTSDDITSWYGAPVTTLARTVVDQARHDRRDGIMACDAALRQGLVTRAQLERTLGSARGWPGVRQARAIVALADPRAESPLESLTRLALHDDGFPPAEPQVIIRDPRWRWWYRVDLLFKEQRLIIEADGREKYEPRDGEEDDDRWGEKRRETRLRGLDYRVERVLWEDVVHNWPDTSRRLRRLLSP